MRIAVTGATGFIGQALVARARAAGIETLPLTRADLAPGDPARLGRRLEGWDCVVHLAARAHRGGTDGDFECNVDLARTVALAARDAGVGRFVLLSSIGVNGNLTQGRAFTEQDRPSPLEPYARSKWRAEQEVERVLADGVTSWVILRPPLVYGAAAPGNFARLVQAVSRGVPLPLASVENERSLVAVENLCDCILLAATHDAAAGQLFLVADGTDCSTPELVRSIALGLGRPARLWPCPPRLLRLAAAAAGRSRIAESLCDSLQVDSGKVRRMLGWSPAVATREGVVRAVSRWRTAA